MKKKPTKQPAETSALVPSAPNPDPASGLLASLRAVIVEARRQAITAVDVVQVRTCWVVGRHIVEFEQAGQTRAAYGKAVLAQVSAQLTAEFGKGFDASNLYKMSQFYRAFPNLDALRLNLSWTHYRQIAERIWNPDDLLKGVTP